MIKAIQSAILKGAIGLGIFAVVTAGLIATTQVSTKERIETEIKKSQSKALHQIIPKQTHDNELIESAVSIKANDDLGLEEDSEAYLSIKNGEVNAIILPVIAPDGYTGAIRMIVGIHTDDTVAGVRVLSHKETPGLGDKVDIRKSDWIDSFVGKSLNNPSEGRWKVIKDGGEFDQFTGATITPRAVVSAVHKALKYFEKNKAQLISTSSPSSRNREPTQ